MRVVDDTLAAPERPHGLAVLHEDHFADLATAQVGRADARRAERAVVRSAAYRATPHRFVKQTPVPAALPAAAWINRPAPPPPAPAAE